MIVFGPAQNAVNAALEMQQAVTVEGQLHPPALGLRVGLGAGEAIEDGGDFFGGPVIVASRLCGRSSPGQILATTEVAEMALAQAEVAFSETGSLAPQGHRRPCRNVRGLDARRVWSWRFPHRCTHRRTGRVG